MVLCIKHSEMNGICGSEKYRERVGTEMVNFKWIVQMWRIWLAKLPVMCFFGYPHANNSPHPQNYSILTHIWNSCIHEKAQIILQGIIYQ